MYLQRKTTSLLAILSALSLQSCASVDPHSIVGSNAAEEVSVQYEYAVFEASINAVAFPDFGPVDACAVEVVTPQTEYSSSDRQRLVTLQASSVQLRGMQSLDCIAVVYKPPLVDMSNREVVIYARQAEGSRIGILRWRFAGQPLSITANEVAGLKDPDSVQGLIESGAIIVE